MSSDEFRDPEQYLAQSQRALEAGNGADAAAAALQGILQLLIVQHVQAFGDAELEREQREGAAEAAELPNPMGECHDGHETFRPPGECAFCDIDRDELQADTVEVKEDRRDSE